MQTQDEVDYVSGKTRVFGIVGHPIAQVRSPEMFTAEFRRRGVDAILVPLHVLPEDFDAACRNSSDCRTSADSCSRFPTRCGRARWRRRWAARRGSSARSTRWPGTRTAAGARTSSTVWAASRRSGEGRFRFAGKRVMLLGAGGAGSAIAVAIGGERPASLRIYDVDAGRAEALARKVAHANPGVDVHGGRADGRRRRHPAQRFAGRHAGRRADAVRCRVAAARPGGVRRDRQARAHAACWRWPRPAAARPFTAAK